MTTEMKPTALVVMVGFAAASTTLGCVERELSRGEGDPVGVPWSGMAPDLGVYEGGTDFAQIEVEAPMRADVGESVTFEAEVHGNISVSEICWQFGDGGGSCGSSVTHTYESPYDYGVRVRVWTTVTTRTGGRTIFS